ncbi:TIGR02453 family protein [Robiginitalea myxolifaciens]|uniref:TIGR02453 family protein n=1 Tax=Robiginitalea myxolifaciens TaxID=400055 RepID=A0A1I6FMW8_9FLAO|nr:DUF2461 domain-containing protein [Robiginitalea myxolifaciens]SFR31286.1 TIGR02453 family protein [Robiginitalea myxolifaciens]
MNFHALFDFLERLWRNNHKAWMDEHRAEYHKIRNDFIQWLDELDAILDQRDPDYYPTPGKQGINRINNNLMFHPDRPVYKDHFGAGLDKAPGTADFYIQIGVGDCLLAGGLWRPGPKKLRKVREAIDYDGEVMQEILDTPSFKAMFGGLYEDQVLQRMPKGFNPDHPHAALLKHKTLAVERTISREDILSPDFQNLILDTYFEMLPFRRYLNRALSVEI